MSKTQVLIIDDDPQVCRLLAQMITAWQMTANSLTEPLLVPGDVQLTDYQLILLDVMMSDMNGLDLLVDLQKLSPDTKVIIMTGYADKDLAIQALRRGAFDFLEKPIAMDLLAHAVQRALRTQQMELEHRSALEQLERNQKVLEARTAQLEQSNRELLETNTALSVLARNVERTRQETERQVREQLQRLIIPVLENHIASLRQHDHLEYYESQLTMLSQYIADVGSGLATSLQARTALSSMELRVALLIQHGLGSDAISEQLSISPETVKTHRRNIRKKLGLTGTKSRLRPYLQSLDQDPLGPTSMDGAFLPSNDSFSFGL